MFLRLKTSLPADFEFPADLEKLGYFVNDKDQIRQIDAPEKRFHYFISKNERYVQMHREAMNECIRKIVLDRLLCNSLQITRLPLGTPAYKNHVPILTSSNIDTCKRCIGFVGEPSHDLGILAGRMIDSHSIGYGSIINLVEYMQAKSPEKDVGIVIANPGQPLWYRRGEKALSYTSWDAIPRATAVDSPLKITSKNKVPKNDDAAEHVVCVFDEIIAPLVARGCKIDVVAVGMSAIDLVEFLQLDWGRWESGLEACVVTSGHVWRTEFTDPNFKGFWEKRARAYVTSDEPIGAPLSGRSHFGCNVYASGEQCYVECITPKIYEHVLDYFELVHRTPEYENEIQPDLEVEEQTRATEPDWTEQDGPGSLENLKIEDQMVGATKEAIVNGVIAQEVEDSEGEIVDATDGTG